VQFEPFVYEERYGWNRQSVWLICASLLVCVVVLVIPAQLWIRVPVSGALSLGAVIPAMFRLGRRTAFRVDATGVTLRASVFSLGDPQFYPWADIQNLVVWEHTRVWCIGVQRRGRAWVPAGPASPAARWAARTGGGIALPRVPAEITTTGIGVSDWQLDRQRLAVAVGHFAPQVQIINATAQRPAA
jgi:hypothetical protein